MGNDIELRKAELPQTIDELSRFALIGRDKLQAVRAEISAIKKVGLASDVLEQKRKEAQEIAELVTLSEMRMGEMLRDIPKQQGQRSDLQPHHTDVKKSDVLEEIGINRMTANRFEQMAEHPEIVEQAIAEARENDDIVSRSFVLRKIQEAKKPHVAFNSGQNEWYTPSEFIEAARIVMGSIDLDPASSDIANKTVQANEYYTSDDNGLDKPWFGNIWMNPPYSSDLIGRFIDKLEAERCNYHQAIVLVNNATETTWFMKLVTLSSVVCFTRGRVRFLDTDGNASGAPLQGQAILYIGSDDCAFCDVFSDFGWTAMIV